MSLYLLTDTTPSFASLYRTQTLEESITPGFADNTIATAGTQTMSYDLSGDLSSIVQRIDRAYMIGEYWYFGRSQLEPMNVSLVSHSGPQGYGCYVKGNEGIYQDPAQLGGYTDRESACLTAFLRAADVLMNTFSRVYARSSPRLYTAIAKAAVDDASSQFFHNCFNDHRQKPRISVRHRQQSQLDRYLRPRDISSIPHSSL
jgi:hypothetical protein